MTAKRTLAILNLSGEFPVELANYFASREIQVINPLIDSTKLEWTHIFTKSVEDFSIIEKTHQTLEKNIQIVSLTKVSDLREFVLSGGKMVFDEQWLSGSMGGFILDKFFQEYAGISIEDNYPNFQEIGSFNITNPFSTGDYLDRLVFNAFEKNMNALAVKTYFDHLLMYLTGLKNKGKIGVPIEVSYGTLNEVFGVQMNFFAQDLSVEDITMCLSSSITKRPEEYLLNISVQSADFFDFTFLAEVNKVVITGLWTSDPAIKIDNRGLMFTHLSPSAKIGAYPTKAADAFVIHDDKIEDMTARVNIPEREEEIPEVEAEAAPAPLEEQVTVIGPSGPEEEVSTKVGGGEEEDDFSKVVKGSKEEKDNFSMKIGGGKEAEKGAFNVKSSGLKEEDKGAFNVKSLGNGLSKDAANSFFKSGASEKEKELEEKLKLAIRESEALKTKIKMMAGEIELVKGNKSRMNDLRQKTEELEALTSLKGNSADDELRKQFQQKLAESRQLSPQEMAKLNGMMERENKYLEEARQNELRLKKLQLELTQKDIVFNQELEKAQRVAVSKEMIAEKMKETMARVVEKKDEELNSMRERFEQVNKTLASGPNQSHVMIVKDLEKQNINLNKMLEVYKAKLTTLATTLETSKGDDSVNKDEARRVTMLNTQLKLMTETQKKELDKLKDRYTQDNILIGNLRQEKIKLEQLVKKTTAEGPKAQATANVQLENELLKHKQQNQVLDVQLRETNLKLKDMEKRLTEALKNAKGGAGGPEENSKAKVNHLEASVKKLTADLIAAQNQTGEMKKETNKIRSENQSLQNQLAATKKELEKLKPASPKTPGSPGGTGGNNGKAA